MIQNVWGYHKCIWDVNQQGYHLHFWGPYTHWINDPNTVSMEEALVILFDLYCTLYSDIQNEGKSPEKLRKSTTEMTKLDIKGATDRLASMRGVDIVGANNNLQEGKNLLTLAPGMLFVTIFESFDLSKNLLWAWGAGLLSGLLIVTLRRFPLNVATLEPAFKVSVFFQRTFTLQTGWPYMRVITQ